MQNDAHHHLRRRGSSPQQEIRQAFDDWMRNLRSFNGTSDRSLSVWRGTIQPGPPRINLITPESVTSRDPDDEGRWQDDGGEGG